MLVYILHKMLLYQSPSRRIVKGLPENHKLLIRNCFLRFDQTAGEPYGWTARVQWPTEVSMWSTPDKSQPEEVACRTDDEVEKVRDRR